MVKILEQIEIPYLIAAPSVIKCIWPGEVRKPAMQAGLTRKRRTYKEIFSSAIHFRALRNVTFVFFDSPFLVDVGDWHFSVAA
jgi:hypothetical protein